VCYYLALPPLNLYLLAFLVPVFWTLYVQNAAEQTNPDNKRSGFKSFASIYLTAFVFWISSIYWISFPHPILYLALFALAAFLSIYWVLFFYAARVAVHRFKIPAVLAVPLCWVGCEYLRFHLLGGFSFCALQHAFYKLPLLLQLANIGGEYAVAAWIFAIGAALAVLFRRKVPAATPLSEKIYEKTFYAFMLVFLLLSVLVHGFFSGLDFDISMQKPLPNPVKIAALQGNIPLTLATAADVSDKTFRQLADLAYQAAKKDERVLIIFPETTCPIPILEFTGEVKPANVGLTEEQADDWRRQLQEFVDEIQTPVLFGCSTYQFRDSETPKRLNSALYLLPSAVCRLPFPPRYDKIELVMFGEYIPFSEYLPDDFFIKTLCQEAGRGKDFTAMDFSAAGLHPSALYFTPNICFESTVPHFIRQSVVAQATTNKIAVLINLSNDAWFHGSRQVDQHLATMVFRAVENGVWHISANNGGFSVIIRPDGTIQNIGSRGQAKIVEGTIYPELHWNTVYQTIGDIPALLCALAVLFFVILPSKRRAALAPAKITTTTHTQ